MYKLAEKYDELLRQYRFRSHKLRLLVLRTLCMHTDFTDVAGLWQLLADSGIESEKEKLRMIIKRLHETGFLERKKVSGKNKFLFRLRPYEDLLKESTTWGKSKNDIE
ncbi:MAG: hypothetical protein FD123_933 [Bacteroidetes bacterium]|nr:MAG: hypothetical protein FD123_933 [Bacteroidota bacterium]